jgi:hypothetical protein
MRRATQAIAILAVGLYAAARAASASAGAGPDSSAASVGAPASESLGASHISGKYSFTDEDFLNEGADQLLAMGTRVIKVWLSFRPKAQYPFHSSWGQDTNTLVETAQKPYFRALFAKPFSTFVIIANGGSSSFQNGFTAAEHLDERHRMRDLARYLLTTYAGTGKTFVLQNWEGDHLLRAGLADGEQPGPERVAAMADWLTARQEGVDDARREIGDAGVTVAHAVEANSLTDAMAGKVTVTNDVLPLVSPDLVSYSSWDVGFAPGRLVRALDYLAAHARPSALYGHRNVYLGEYGVTQEQLPPGVDQAVVIRDLWEAALGWGVRYALYWQLYSNERARDYTGRPTDRDMKSLWLIPPDGSHTPMWKAFVAQMPQTLARGLLLDGDGHALRAADVTAGSTGTLTAWSRRRDGWATFTVHGLDGGALEDGARVTLQAHNGRYWRAQSDGVLVADATRGATGTVFFVRRVAGAGTLQDQDPLRLAISDGRFVAVIANAPATLAGTGTVLRYVVADD